MSEVLAQLEKKGGGDVKRSLYTGSTGYTWTVFNYSGELVSVEYLAKNSANEYFINFYSDGTKYGNPTYLYMLEVDESNKQVKIRSYGNVTLSYTLIVFTK